MSVFDMLIFQKLAGKFTHTTIDNPTGMPPLAAGTMSNAPPLSDDVTLSAPETTYGTILDVSGSGFLMLLELRKPSTTNGVYIRYQITLDGTVIATDLAAAGVATAARDSIIVGQMQRLDSGAPSPLTPVFLPFHTALKIEAKYNSTPGSSEDITAFVHAVYS